MGPLELAIVLVVALIVLGPKRLPDAGRALGHGIREFKDSLSNADPREDLAGVEPEDIEDPPEPVTTAAATAPAAPAADDGDEKS